jgi:hypothetical protein
VAEQVATMPMEYLFVGAVTLTLLVTIGAVAFLFASRKNRPDHNSEVTGNMELSQSQGSMI